MVLWRSGLIQRWHANCVGSDGLLALELIPLVPFPSSGLLIEDERGKPTVVITGRALECGHSTLHIPADWSTKADPKHGHPSSAERPKAMVFWGNEQGNSWTFWMLWKLKEEIHTVRRNNQLFPSEKSLQQKKKSVHWSHLILFATLSVMQKNHRDSTPCLNLSRWQLDAVKWDYSIGVSHASGSQTSVNIRTTPGFV